MHSGVGTLKTMLFYVRLTVLFTTFVKLGHCLLCSFCSATLVVAIIIKPLHRLLVHCYVPLSSD